MATGRLEGTVIHWRTSLLASNNFASIINGAISPTPSRNRAGSPQAVKETYYATVGWFIKRRPQSREALARYTEELEDRLRDAGIADVEVFEVPGPHYGSVVNPQAINPILIEHVLYASKNAGCFLTNDQQTHQAPTDCKKMTTHFSNRLAEYGYNPNEDEDDLVGCDLEP
ncbi:hypothetical protein C0992_008729 [Termitomyces sp. T32_za158]|nr:hypothetical protein C0992_008729 [Termitomyces sp. T32_za158]